MRSADDSLQPWVVWPGQADGTGTLIVSANQGATAVSRVTVPGAQMMTASASYPVDLGCVPAATLTLRVFLDDNENAEADATFSSDYLDSCMLDRQPTLAIQPGVVNETDLVLNNSCD